MAQYIDKATLVAEIERRITDNKKDIERASHKNLEDYFEGYEDALVLFKQQYLDTIETKEVDLKKEFYDFLDTLEAKEDLETFDKEVTKMWGRCAANPNDTIACLHIDSFIEIARHFYELGLKAQKGE